MKKAFVLFLTLAIAGTLGFGTFVEAHCGSCGVGKSAKTEKSSGACCGHAKVAKDSYKALQADYEKLKKGVSAEDQEAFLKAHQENLQNYFAAKDSCKAACSAKASGSEKVGCKPGCTAACCAGKSAAKKSV